MGDEEAVDALMGDEESEEERGFEDDGEEGEDKEEIEGEDIIEIDVTVEYECVELAGGDEATEFEDVVDIGIVVSVEPVDEYLVEGLLLLLEAAS